MMSDLLGPLRTTTDTKSLGVIRIFLGMMFLSTGIMDFAVPMLWDAFSDQFTQAEFSFHTFDLYFFPVTEIVLGVLLLLGAGSRSLDLAASRD